MNLSTSQPGQSTPNPFTDTFASAGFTQSFGPPGGVGVGVQDINLGFGGPAFAGIGMGVGLGPQTNLNLNLNPNSPEGFRASLQLALSYVGEVMRLAQVGRNGM